MPIVQWFLQDDLSVNRVVQALQFYLSLDCILLGVSNTTSVKYLASLTIHHAASLLILTFLPLTVINAKPDSVRRLWPMYFAHELSGQVLMIPHYFDKVQLPGARLATIAVTLFYVAVRAAWPTLIGACMPSFDDVYDATENQKMAGKVFSMVMYVLNLVWSWSLVQRTFSLNRSQIYDD